MLKNFVKQSAPLLLYEEVKRATITEISEKIPATFGDVTQSGVKTEDGTGQRVGLYPS